MIPRTVLLLLPDNDERRALLRGNFPNIVLQPCISARTLRERVDRKSGAIICGTGLGLVTAPSLLERIECDGIKLIIRCALTHSSAIELESLSQRVSGFQVSLTSQKREKEFVESIPDLLSAPDPGPIAPMLREVSNFIPKDALRFIIAALVLGAHRTEIDAYADVFGLARRSLQAALQRTHLPSPRMLLAWGQACWMVWRMNQNRLNSKQTAGLGGFANAARMSAVLRPITGHSSKALLRLDAISILTTVLQKWIADRKESGQVRTVLDLTTTLDRPTTGDRRKNVDCRRKSDRRSKRDRRSNADRRSASRRIDSP